jgi:quercetin dioxygenase-like cupin family protein
MATERTDVKCLARDEGRAFALMGSSLTFKDEPEDNGGAMLVFEHRCPSGLGVPPHSELNHEAFYVLEGTLEVEIAGEPRQLGPGDFLHVPPGVVHSLHNPGPGPMRVLTVVSPGDGHVRFFSTLGEPIDDPSILPEPAEPPQFERVQRIASECGIEFLPPQQPTGPGVA